MTNADKPFFASTLSDFGIIYGKTITADLTRVYWGILKDMSRMDFETAIRGIQRTGEFFPKPSDFIKNRRYGWT